MKRLIISIIFCVVCTKVNATTPFTPKVFKNDSWVFVAGFAWPDEDGKVLIIRTAKKTSLLSLDELGIKQIGEWSTAGSRWYQNSIGYVTSLRIKGMDSKSHLRVFYFRDRNGRESIVDLNSNKLIDPKTILKRADLDKLTISKAASLLKSNNPQDRQTAAIHLGQLGASKYLQELTNLLNDKATYTQISGKEEKTVYYVKEAAERAIQLLNSKILPNKAIDSNKK